MIRINRRLVLPPYSVTGHMAHKVWKTDLGRLACVLFDTIDAGSAMGSLTRSSGADLRAAADVGRCVQYLKAGVMARVGLVDDWSFS